MLIAIVLTGACESPSPRVTTAVVIPGGSAEKNVVAGGKFDSRAFHDRITAGGPVPLPKPEKKTDRWKAGQCG